MARPKLFNGEKKSKALFVKIPQRAFELMERVAQEDNRTPSAVHRTLILDGLTKYGYSGVGCSKGQSANSDPRPEITPDTTSALEITEGRTEAQMLRARVSRDLQRLGWLAMAGSATEEPAG